jgi:DNA transformation protein
MSEDVEFLRNIGPKSARRLREVGIATAARLRRLGSVAAYRRLKHAFPREVSLVMLYALEGALLGCHWNHLPDGRKEALLQELEADHSRSRRA